MDTSAVIVAAGASARMSGINKQLAQISGVPVVIMSALAFDASSNIKDIVIVSRAEDMEQIRILCKEHNITKPVCVTEGADTRQESVVCGIACTNSATNYIAVHDGARPLVTTKHIDAVIRDARKYGAATLGVSAKDTIKVVGVDNFILTTPPRSSLFITQTPQVFCRTVYTEAVRDSDVFDFEPTDDCQMVESAGYAVYMTEGEYSNIKITTPDDLYIAEAILQSRASRQKL